MTPLPLAAAPAGRFIDPTKTLSFTFEGRSIPAVAGQTIAAALYATGVRTFSRSFKYHRPRGLLCMSGDCPNCLMQVDGRPNVRTCTEPARQGQVVRGQNAWPGLRFDLLRIFDRLSYFLPVGFYYKVFHKPRWLWPLFEKVVRNIAGLGRIDVHAKPACDTEIEHLHAQVCVIGAGPAGLAAAAAAAAAGANVVLLDRQQELGGHLLFDGDMASSALPSFIAILRDRPSNVRVLLDTNVFGLYEGNTVGAFQQDRLLKIRAAKIIVCTGGRERPFLFANNDLPGIFLGRAVLRLGRLYGVRAGQRAVVATDNDDGHRLAEQLRDLGIEVAAIVDSRPKAGRLQHNIQILPGHVVVRAGGGSRLKKVGVATLNEACEVIATSEQQIECDLLCMAPRLTPANELLHQGGMRFSHENGRWQPSRTVAGLFAAGAAAGTFNKASQLIEGRLRGLEAAGIPSQPSIADLKSQLEVLATNNFHNRPIPFDLRSDIGSSKSFVCLCEDVAPKDLQQAIAEGFDHIETLKRYATVGMGPCQGKICGQTASELCASITKKLIGSVGTTTSRPPMVPVEMAVLAAERRHHPVRRTPMYHWHEAAGARWLDAGQWKRPESYGDPAAEVRAVRNAVGVIDVSTLGKIDIVGPDAAELLDRVCLGDWASLAVGKVRYAAMCTEEGIVFDDGIGARLGPEEFYLTASTGNAEAVFQWLELWRTTWQLDATVLNRTSALAAVNLAGPRSRDVLSRLTTLALSPTAFPPSALRHAEVAGVSCRLLRVGFVGELGYEIHCVSSHGWHLWESLMAAGAEHGIKPFGVEAQRILRLEKGHPIVGQDTDALSNPFGAGLGWMVKFTKARYHGRESLIRYKEMGPRTKLVGFTFADGVARKADHQWPRELEGCQVVEQGRSVGRVTSARFSPTLEKYIGLAWVPASRATAGDRFSIRCNRADLPALVTALPFYDPRGERLKS